MRRTKRNGTTKLRSKAKSPAIRLVKADNSIVGYQYDLEVEGRSVTVYSDKPGKYAAVRYFGNTGGLGEIFNTKAEAEAYLIGTLPLAKDLPQTAIVKPTSVRVLRADGTEERVNLSKFSTLIKRVKGIFVK